LLLNHEVSNKTPGTPVWMLDQHQNPPSLPIKKIIYYIIKDFSPHICIPPILNTYETTFASK
jgi:hypothetical protein